MKWILSCVAALAVGLMCVPAEAGHCRDVSRFRQVSGGGYVQQQQFVQPVRTYQFQQVQQFQQVPVQTYQAPVQQFQQPVVVQQPVFVQERRRQSVGAAFVNALGRIAIERQRQRFFRDSRRDRRGFRRR